MEVVYFRGFKGEKILKDILQHYDEVTFTIIDLKDIQSDIRDTNVKIFHKDPQKRSEIRQLLNRTGKFEENLTSHECNSCTGKERRIVFGFRGCDIHDSDEAPGIDRIIMEYIL